MVFLSAFSFFCVCRVSPFGIICGDREKRIKPHSIRENPVVTETGVPPLLELNRVTVIRGDENKKVLDRISFKVLPGEHVAILGPNGAGKSSLIKVMTREYYPLARKGSFCKVWGEKHWNIFELRHLCGIVSNDLQGMYARDISGLEAVLSGFFGSIGLQQNRVTPAQKRKALKILKFLGIESLKDRKMSVMSSGEARRFLIGRALVHDPRALILDEPTHSLDIKAAYHFKNMMRKIAASGVSIILVTQNLQDIIPEISRIILMKNGRVMMDGPKTVVLTRRNISRLFDMPIPVTRKKGYYHAMV